MRWQLALVRRQLLSPPRGLAVSAPMSLFSPAIVMISDGHRPREEASSLGPGKADRRGPRKEGSLTMSRSHFLLQELLKLVIAAACLVGAIAAYKVLLHPLIGSASSLDESSLAIVRRVSFLLAVVLAYWAFVRFYERRPVRELAPRGEWILLAAVAGSLSIGVTILALYAAGPYELVSFRGFGEAGGVFLTLWVAAVLEEVAFRGILFRILEEALGTRAALFGSAVLFSLAHLQNNGFRAVTLLSVTLGGLMWAEVFILSRNLWVAAAHHCCWNATIFMIGLPLSGENWQAQAPWESVVHGASLWTGGAFGPEDSLVNLVVCLAICAALWGLARKRGQVLPPRSGPRSGEAPAPVLAEG